MDLKSAAGTNVGLVRPQNEDSYHCSHPLYVVADGLGGHAAGEVASKMAVDRLRQVAVDGGTSAEEAQQELAEAVRDANRRIHSSATEDVEHAGMGTTVTAAIAVGNVLGFAHVGDSRAYLFREGKLTRITDDHTPVERAVRAGVLTADEALHHPSRHVLAQAVGLDVDVEVDTPAVELQSGDRVLMCTDGLTDPVPDPDLERLLARFDTPKDAVDGLIGAALNGGGPDNVTLIIIDAA